jgi:hypothetical protein
MLTYTGNAVSGNNKARPFMPMLRKQNFEWKIILLSIAQVGRTTH